MKDITELVKQAMEAHKKAFENWTKGKPVEEWVDDDGNICIKYQDGTWYHYKKVNNYWEWW